MNNNNNLKIDNFIWLDRGIKLTIIYMLYSRYKYIKYKNIIINNKNFRNFAKLMFPELSILKYDKKISDPFYFNIRHIIKKQDIIIDYIKNYDNSIFTKKISLVPWYDINDPLIVYKYNKKYNININKYKDFINIFSKSRKENYNNNISWDRYTENIILNLYNNKYNTNIIIKFNSYVLNDYTIINNNNLNNKNNIIILKKYNEDENNLNNEVNENYLNYKKNILEIQHKYDKNLTEVINTFNNTINLINKYI